MKSKTILIFSLLLASKITNAQWTGTNPLTTTSKVGIGTTSPQEAFQIGDRFTFHDGGFKAVTYNFTYNGGDKRILTDYSSGLFFTNYGTILLRTAVYGAAGSAITWQNQMTILNNGFIGIGTQAPVDRLDVFGNVRLNDNTIYFRGGGDSNHGLGYRGTNPFAGQAIDGPVLYGWSGGALGSTGGGQKIALKWDSNGKVLIGNPSLANFQGTPGSYLLYVQQGILTEKVKVAVATTSDWSDYVFNENYKLRTINELEAFVKANKHLPNVPSAEEVVKEGVDMAKMDAKLLEKIEELSLYIIELKKGSMELKKENVELVKRMEKIENK